MSIQIKEINGVDNVVYEPVGVCSKVMQLRIQDGVVLDAEFIGGCSGNLSGIGVLIKGMKVEDIVPKLSGLRCGSRGTSCPDQLSQCLNAYLEKKNSEVKIGD